MAHTLQDLVENPELLAKNTNPICAGKCQKPLPADREEWRRTEEGTCCTDCYYDALGEEIEKHPIGGGGIRRS